MIKNNLTWKIKTNSQWFYTSRKKHKNQILSWVACCIRLKCSAPGEPKDYQEAKHDSLTVSVTWHYNLITRMYVSQDVQHCNRKTKIGANGEYMEMAGCGGNSRSIQQGRGSQNEIAGRRDPSTSICGFTRHPDLEVNNGGDLMICRSGTGWRHWSRLGPEEYKNAHWKPTHHERNSGDPRKSWQCYLSSMPLKSTQDVTFQHKRDSWLLGWCWSPQTFCCSWVQDWEHESAEMLFLSVCILRKNNFLYRNFMNIAMTMCGMDISCSGW